MRIQDLNEQRARKIAEMRTLTEAPEGNGGDLSDEQAKRFDTLKGEVTNLEKRVERQALIDAADRRAADTTTLSGSGNEQFDVECRQFSLRSAIAAQVPDIAGSVDTGREREISAELQRRSGRKTQGIAVPMEVFEQRVITTAAPAGGPGGNIIATDHLGAQFIDTLRANLVTGRLGARVLNDLQGDVNVPRLKSSAAAGWFAENAAIGTSDAEIDQVALTPKHVGARTEFSRNMLLQSSPDIEQLIRADFAAILAEAVDRAAINGGGSNEPDGILQTTGIGDVAIGTNGGPITWSKAIDLIAEVEIDNAMGTAMLTNPKVVKSGRKTLKESGDAGAGYVIDMPDRLAGYPLASTNLVPSDLDKGTSTGVCSALIFGNFGDLILGYWSSFDLLVNPYESTAYSKGNVQVRGIITMDVAVRHPESFAAIKDLTTA